MRTSHLLRFRNPLSWLLVFSLLFANVSAIDCDCYFCDTQTEVEMPEICDLGEYQHIIDVFDECIEKEDTIEVKSFFLKKWCTNLKRWFKKKLITMIKGFIPLQKMKSLDHTAYAFAEFKRKIDRKMWRTGDITDLIKTTRPDLERYPQMEQLVKKIQYYCDNPHATPSRTTGYNRWDQAANKTELEDIPPRALIGGLEIFCGALIRVLPFPGCKVLAWTLITHGTNQIYEGYMNRYEDLL